MELIIPSSSFIKMVHFDGASGVLTVEMLNGKAYDYRGVPRPVFEEFVQAESAGEFFNKNIRGKYR